MASVQRVENHIKVTLGPTPTAKVVQRTVQSVKITQQGARGLRGERGAQGEQGPPGPVGSFDDADLPDFTLIFANKLV